MAKSTTPTKQKSPTALTVDLLRQAGWTVHRVEHRHPFANRWVDLLGVADYLAMQPGEGLMLVQLTSDSKKRTATGNVKMRRDKLLASAEARLWVESGGRLCLIGWLRAPKGQDGLVAHVEEITIKDFAAATAARSE